MGERYQETYHGWLLELIPHSEGYSFYCWLPEGWIGVSDRHLYCTLDRALAAAQQRADLESVRWALFHFLSDIHARHGLDPDEYFSLTYSVSTFISSAVKSSTPMLTSSNTLESHSNQLILCAYKNTNPHIQVARISNIENWYFERVVFPGEIVVFEAFPEAQLEIHTGTEAGSTLAETIPCSQLQAQ